MGYICSRCAATLSKNQSRCPVCGGRREYDGNGGGIVRGKKETNVRKFKYMAYDSERKLVGSYHTPGEAKMNCPQGGWLDVVLQVG